MTRAPDFVGQALPFSLCHPRFPPSVVSGVSLGNTTVARPLGQSCLTEFPSQGGNPIEVAALPFPGGLCCPIRYCGTMPASDSLVHPE